MSLSSELPIVKSAPEQHMVWGWANVATKDGMPVIDRQGDVVDIEELRKAAHNFMKNHRTSGDMHSVMGVGTVVESIVLDNDLQKALGIDLGQEGWFIGVKVTNEKVWKRIKSGELSAFSIGGGGRRTALSPAHKVMLGLQKGIMQLVKRGNPNHDAKGRFASSSSDSSEVIDPASSGIANGWDGKGTYDPDSIHGPANHMAMNQRVMETFPKIADPAKAGNKALTTFKQGERVITTGKPATFEFLHDPVPSPKLGNVYGQEIEPKGTYLHLITETGMSLKDWYQDQQQGTVSFKNPIVMHFVNTQSDGWKKNLSVMYGGLTGRRLTDAIIQSGHDGIITYDPSQEGDWLEGVNLTGTVKIEKFNVHHDAKGRFAATQESAVVRAPLANTQAGATLSPVATDSARSSSSGDTKTRNSSPPLVYNPAIDRISSATSSSVSSSSGRSGIDSNVIVPPSTKLTPSEYLGIPLSSDGKPDLDHYPLSATAWGRDRLALRDKYLKLTNGGIPSLVTSHWLSKPSTVHDATETAKADLPEYTQKLEEWGKAAGNDYVGSIIPPLKFGSSLDKKMQRKKALTDKIGAQPIQKVGDLLRGSILVKTPQAAKAVVDAARKSGWIIEVEDYFAHPSSFGYGAVHIQLQNPKSGLVCELQIHTPATWDSRVQFGGHDIYDMWSAKHAIPISGDRAAARRFMRDINYARKTYLDANKKALEGNEYPPPNAIIRGIYDEADKDYGKFVITKNLSMDKLPEPDERLETFNSPYKALKVLNAKYNVAKFNLNHDERGRFASNGSAADKPQAFIPQEAVSSGPNGFVPESANASDDEVRSLNHDVEVALTDSETNRDAVSEAMQKFYGVNVPVIKKSDAMGVFQGKISPNTAISVRHDVNGAQLDVMASLRGLVTGQDAQVWTRRLRDDAPDTTGEGVGFVVHGGAPNALAALGPMQYEKLQSIIKSDPKFAPLDGSTFKDGSFLFRNFTSVSDAEYNDLLTQATQRLQDETGRRIHIGTGRYQGNFIAASDYISHVGHNADALRWAADYISNKTGPIYLKHAKEIGANVDVAAERINERAQQLRSAADQIEKQPMAKFNPYHDRHGKFSAAIGITMSRNAEVKAMRSGLPKDHLAAAKIMHWTADQLDQDGNHLLAGDYRRLGDIHSARGGKPVTPAKKPRPAAHRALRTALRPLRHNLPSTA